MSEFKKEKSSVNNDPKSIIRDALVDAFTLVAKRIAIACCVAYFAISSVNYFFNSGYDDTDRGDGKRSGLALHTDYGTGCQYLLTSKGGITPRMEGGKHKGCK